MDICFSARIIIVLYGGRLLHVAQRGRTRGTFFVREHELVVSIWSEATQCIALV